MADAFCAEEIRFSFAGVSLIKGVSFAVPQRGIFAITGRSGCGKSTLLEICSSQRTPESGRIFWDGECITDLTHNGIVLARQRIGYVFQKHALIHNFTIYDNIALPLRYHRHYAERDVRTAVKKCMEELGLFNVDKKFPNELSAAQSRCAAIARAVVMEPAILFLDEPTAGVDPITAQGIGNVLLSLNKSQSIAIIMMCNNVEILKMMHCPVTILENGKLYDYRDPAASHEGVADMFSVLRDAL
jgi:ABC-type methionine transport system ATPase subunit